MDVLRRAIKHTANKGILSLLRTAKNKIIKIFITETVQNQLASRPTIYGPDENVTIHENAIVSDALLNSRSGTILVKEHAAFGHDVKILTGKHDYTETGKDRLLAIPEAGNDIIIETGAWIASGAIILGPCRIGENAVVTAGSVVLTDVEKNTVYGGVPAEYIKHIDVNPNS